MSVLCSLDVNECLDSNGGCDGNAGCINTDGSYHCMCDDGFDGNGMSCEDIQECILNPTLCDNGECLNYPGGYRCECDMGFHPDDMAHMCTGEEWAYPVLKDHSLNFMLLNFGLQTIDFLFLLFFVLCYVFRRNSITL